MKLVRGFGQNDLITPTATCPIYKRWTNIIDRCYSQTCIAWPYYGGKGVTICQDWCSRANFTAWYYSQSSNLSLHIDKDILIPNSNIYSPETCRLVPTYINSLLKGVYLRDHLLPGVNIRTVSARSVQKFHKKKYFASHNRNGVKGHENFENQIDAHLFWLSLKIKDMESRIKTYQNDEDYLPEIHHRLFEILTLMSNKLENNEVFTGFFDHLTTPVGLPVSIL